MVERNRCHTALIDQPDEDGDWPLDLEMWKWLVTWTRAVLLESVLKALSAWAQQKIVVDQSETMTVAFPLAPFPESIVENSATHH